MIEYEEFIEESLDKDEDVGKILIAARLSSDEKFEEFFIEKYVELTRKKTKKLGMPTGFDHSKEKLFEAVGVDEEEFKSTVEAFYSSPSAETSKQVEELCKLAIKSKSKLKMVAMLAASFFNVSFTLSNIQKIGEAILEVTSAKEE